MLSIEFSTGINRSADILENLLNCVIVTDGSYNIRTRDLLFCELRSPGDSGYQKRLFEKALKVNVGGTRTLDLSYIAQNINTKELKTSIDNAENEIEDEFREMFSPLFSALHTLLFRVINFKNRISINITLLWGTLVEAKACASSLLSISKKAAIMLAGDEDDSDGIFDMALYAEMTLKELADAINGINDVYSFICEAWGVPFVSPVLEKIESGSLWIRIKGVPKVIKPMIDIFQKAFRLKSGKAALDDEVDSMNRIIETSLKLSKSTSCMEQETDIAIQAKAKNEQVITNIATRLEQITSIPNEGVTINYKAINMPPPRNALENKSKLVNEDWKTVSKE